LDSKDPDLIQVQRMLTMFRRKEKKIWVQGLGFFKHGTSLATGSPPKGKRFNISVKKSSRNFNFCA
jgi:hypothetical protein